MVYIPFPEQYNKRALPPVPQSASTPKEALAATTKLTDFLTRELNGIDRGIKALRLTPTRTITASDNITVNDGVILADATSGNITVTLPDVVTQAGRTFTIKKTDASANTVTVLPTSPTTIDGAVSVVLGAENESVIVVASGVEWEVLGQAYIVAPGTVTGSGTPGVIPKWATSASLGDSIISESGGAISIGGTLAVSGLATVGGTLGVTGVATFTSNVVVNGNTTLGNATSDTVTIAGSLAVDTSVLTVNPTSNFVGVNVPLASTLLPLDVVSQFGIRPSTSYAYPTVLAGGFAGRFYAVHDAGDWGFVVARSANDTLAANLTLYHTRSTTGARTALVSGDLLGRITFQGVSQTSGTVNIGASIIAITNGAVSAGVLPTELRFYTAASGDADSSLTAQNFTIAPTVATFAQALTIGGTLTKTGTGTVTLNPTTAGTLDNVVIGGVTALAGTFTTLTATTRVTSPLLGTTTNTDVVFDRNSAEGFRLSSITNAGGVSELVATNAGGAVMGGIPANIDVDLLRNVSPGLRFGGGVDGVRANNVFNTPPFFALIRGRGSLASPTQVLADDHLFALRGGAVLNDGSVSGQVTELLALALEDQTTTAQGSAWLLRAKPIGSTTLTSILRFGADSTTIGYIQSSQATLRIRPGSSGLVIRDSGNTLDAATFNAAGTLLTLNGGLIVNNVSGNHDFQVNGDTLASLLHADASADRIGIGTATPAYLLDVNGTANATAYRVGGTAGASFGPAAVASITVVNGIVTAIS